ncbi:hypothetical protein [Williamsia sp.]|uniref:hypothetical protein n=1 Tax=Williamsia sp. TaxID=1872085 RepID=UPI001A346FDF|nr:hypothetical protein [Williamsia sp.]MBJ7290656.1 hypothetical protein [Williamsia sp.]
MRLSVSDDADDDTAIRGFGVGDGIRVDPSAVAAVGHRLDADIDALTRAAADAGAARFGPHSVAGDLREHGLAYSSGMRDLGAVVDALAGSVADLVDRFDVAARALDSTDADSGTWIRAAGGDT